MVAETRGASLCGEVLSVYTRLAFFLGLFHLEGRWGWLVEDGFEASG
jgi:hypothetical protein